MAVAAHQPRIQLQRQPQGQIAYMQPLPKFSCDRKVLPVAFQRGLFHVRVSHGTQFCPAKPLNATQRY